MTKIDIFSGFLGAGKTTLIKKLLTEAYAGQKVVLIENEFGEIGIDGGFMKDAGIEITEMNSGCICCSLVGDFGEALEQVIERFAPDRILIEPSGVGKLSDVVRAASQVESENVKINARTVVADVGKAKLYMKNFGEFYNNQIETATCIVLSRTQNVSQEKLDAALELIREHNKEAVIITTPWDELDGKAILAAMEQGDRDLARELMDEEDVCPVCGHHHHHDDDEECCCHHHHDDDEDEHEHEHHHHHHHDDDDDDDEDEECCCHHHHDDEEDEEHEHHHHHHHDDGDDDDGDEDECCCHHHHDDDEEEEHEHHHHHHHHHHHGHDADEIFTSWGVNTARKFTEEKIRDILTALDGGQYGQILRSKGIVPAENGTWIYFDYVPEEHDVRTGSPDINGKLCVIGSNLNEEGLKELFGV
jgi:G3E family GTPase